MLETLAILAAVLGAYALGRRTRPIYPERVGEFEIKPSSIQGLGVFATVTYGKGDYVGVYEGRVVGSHLSWSPYYLMIDQDEEDEEGRVVHDGWGVEGDGPLKYLNHSDDPSCYIEGIFVYAARDLRGGEELTISYGEDWDQ